MKCRYNVQHSLFSQPQRMVDPVGNMSGQVMRHSILTGLHCVSAGFGRRKKSAEGHKKVKNESVMLCLFGALWVIVSQSQITFSQLRYAIYLRESDIKSNHKAHWRKQQFPFKTLWNLSRRWITGLHTRTQEFCCRGFSRTTGSKRAVLQRQSWRDRTAPTNAGIKTVHSFQNFVVIFKTWQ